MDDEKDIWIIDPSGYEDRCIAVRSKTAYIFCYPVVPEVLETGAKVITRDGRTIKKFQKAHDGYVGLVDGEEHRWDSAGRYAGPYVDSPFDAFIPERFFRKDWQTNIKMNNATWALLYGRHHDKKIIEKSMITQ